MGKTENCREAALTGELRGRLLRLRGRVGIQSAVATGQRKDATRRSRMNIMSVSFRVELKPRALYVTLCRL